MDKKIKEVVMVSACRTPIGKFMGSLKDFQAIDLATIVSKEAIRRADINPSIIDELVMGEVYPHMQGSLPARQVAMHAGLPHSSAAVNVNQNCASSMRAMEVAANNIQLGNTEIALVVGVESMTNTPYMLPKARQGYRMGPGKIEDAMLHDALVDRLVPGHMGLTAENVAERYGITREECDTLALMSHQRATKARDEGIFDEQIIPIEIKDRKKGTWMFDKDEHMIADASMEKMAKLKPTFKEDGVVTAANASGVNDGACAAIIMSKEKADELGLKPMLKLVDICSAGVDPKYMGIGPAKAIPKSLNRAGYKFEDVDYWEINEAFAAQFLGVGRKLKEDYGIDLNLEKVNHNGSGIALGHPVGCTGLRIIIALAYEMKKHDYKLGGASLCVGGGPSMCSLWTREI